MDVFVCVWVGRDLFKELIVDFVVHTELFVAGFYFYPSIN